MGIIKMKSKYNRGSTIHHAMVRLARHPHDLNELRKAISNSSTARFREFVVEPLISDGMAEIKDNLFQLTDLGEFWLTIGPQIFDTKTFGDLVIAVKARHHQQQIPILK